MDYDDMLSIVVSPLLRFGLPVEMYQMILMKSAILLHKTMSSSQVYLTLTPVCLQWYEVITRWSWFRNKLRQYLARYPLHTPNLPWEVWEMVLVRCSVEFYLTLGREYSSPAPASFATITSVCFLWNMVLIKRRWFSRTVRHLLRMSKYIGTSIVELNEMSSINTSLSDLYFPYLRCPLKLVALIADESSANGVARHADKIYVAHSNLNKITLFGSESPYYQMKDIIVKDMKGASDLVACAETQQLYVADHDSGVVWRMKLDGTSLDKWIPRQQPNIDRDSTDSSVGDLDIDAAKNTENDQPLACPKSIAVRSIGRLLVVAGNQLTVYGPDGNKLKQLELPQVMDVRHALETSRDTFLVCSTGRSTDVEHDQVSEIDMSGHVLQQYGGMRGNGLGQLHEPSHVAVDVIEPSTTGPNVVGFSRVFVADHGNKRVLMLNNQLQLERVLISDIDAYRLCYVKHTGQLLIGTQNSGVIVYQIRTV